MNSDQGKPLAGRLGKVEHVDVDEHGRAWGSYLRVRVVINAAEPIMHSVSVYSKKMNTIMHYDVMYERLPLFCFSCGLLGHSSVVCTTLADRDSEGRLPYNGERLCVLDRKKKEAASSSDQSQSNRTSRNGTVGVSGPQTST